MDFSKILDGIDNYRNIDTDDILYSLSNFPNQCAKGILLSNVALPKITKKVDHIYICGIGGSALGGDIVKNFAAIRGAVPVTVVRDYLLPERISKNSIVFLISYSGDTEETLSCYHEAKGVTDNIFVLTSGGKLLDLSLKDDKLVFEIPCGNQPRMSTLYLLMPVLITLKELNLIELSDNEIVQLYMDLKSTMQKVARDVSYKDNAAKKMAGEIYGHIPIIWGTTGINDVIAKGWKTEINENAKSMAFYNALPEANHNEIVGSIYPIDVQPKVALIFLRDSDEHPRISKRFEITELLLSDKVGKVLTHQSFGANILSRMVCQLYFGDFVSYYLAILNGVDPTPVELIGNLKRCLKS